MSKKCGGLGLNGIQLKWIIGFAAKEVWIFHAIFRVLKYIFALFFYTTIAGKYLFMVSMIKAYKKVTS